MKTLTGTFHRISLLNAFSLFLHSQQQEKLVIIAHLLPLVPSPPPCFDTPPFALHCFVLSFSWGSFKRLEVLVGPKNNLLSLCEFISAVSVVSSAFPTPPLLCQSNHAKHFGSSFDVATQSRKPFPLPQIRLHFVFLQGNSYRGFRPCPGVYGRFSL